MLRPDFALSQVTQLTSLFDSAGYSSAGVWRRRLWAMALLKLLPSADGTVVRNLDQVRPHNMNFVYDSRRPACAFC